MESTDKGMLVPRMALNDINATAPLSATVAEGTLIYSDGGAVTDGFYYWTGSEWAAISSTQTERDNHVLVKSEADFPSPSGGVITLTTNTLYEINGSVLVSNKIDMNGCFIVGRNSLTDQLIYTGSAELFTGDNGGEINILALSAPSGKLFNLDASLNPSQTFILRDCYVTDCSNIGNLKGFDLVFSEVMSYTSNTTGIVYEDISYLLLDNQGTFQTLTGAFNTIIILGGFAQPLSAFSATALNVSGISSITTSGQLKNTTFIGQFASSSASKQGHPVAGKSENKR